MPQRVDFDKVYQFIKQFLRKDWMVVRIIRWVRCGHHDLRKLGDGWGQMTIGPNTTTWWRGRLRDLTCRYDPAIHPNSKMGATESEVLEGKITLIRGSNIYNT